MKLVSTLPTLQIIQSFPMERQFLKAANLFWMDGGLSCH